MSRLLGVTDVKLDVICPFKRQKIFLYRPSLFGFGNNNCRWHIDLLILSAARTSKYKRDSDASQDCHAVRSFGGGLAKIAAECGSLEKLLRVETETPLLQLIEDANPCQESGEPACLIEANCGARN